RGWIRTNGGWGVGWFSEVADLTDPDQECILALQYRLKWNRGWWNCWFREVRRLGIAGYVSGVVDIDRDSHSSILTDAAEEGNVVTKSLSGTCRQNLRDERIGGSPKRSLILQWVK